LQAPVSPQDAAPESRQGVTQQMPITHAPLEHWRLPAQGPPLTWTAQTKPWQSVVAQSAPTPHPWPTGQVFPTASQLGPPQSRPVSLPSFTPSMQETHVPGLDPKQRLFAQSVFNLQCFLSRHLGHAVPPQSMSVSVPFCTPSLHVGALQVPPVHTRSLQSLPTRHVSPSGHAGHEAPPQSMAVSVPSLIPSVHPAGTHLPLPSHTVPP
jgi:hypothetical protein